MSGVYNFADTELMKIIYISSIGYSGSTLFDRLLETLSNSFSVGEIYILEKCCKYGCRVQSGKDVQQSKFWGQICKNIEEYKIERDCDKDSNIKSLKTTLPLKWRYDNNELFRQVRDLAESIRSQKINTIIDSSKTPGRMAALHREMKEDLHIIHLIRSPWGVVYSNIKHNQGWLSGCWRWLRTNLVIYLYTLFFVSKTDYQRLHYEDITRNPRKEINKIGSRLEIGKLPQDFIKKINIRKSYRLAGNSMMREDIKEIKLDESWKEELSWYQKIVVGILCGPLHLFFKAFN